MARPSHPLRQATRPDFESGDQNLALADLFCGCGGLTLGVADAALAADIALDVRLAVDFDEDATASYTLNFPKADVRTSAVEEIFNGKLGSRPTKSERAVQGEVGDELHALVGGPPCQGHSDLNNHTRRDDPKNAFYGRMARAAEVLLPDVVCIENVPTVRHDKSGVVAAVMSHLEEELGYAVADAVLKLEHLGVAQRRRRHVVLAAKPDVVDPVALLDEIAKVRDGAVDLFWAIGDLADLEDGVGLDKPPRASAANLERMQWLLDNDEYDLPNEYRPRCHQDDHSYKSMYGRLRWSEPAQTLTSGYSSIGQGRYMHPDQTRALTSHEAARIQGFPDYFRFSELAKKDSLATMIGNAVPPALGRALFERLIPHLL